MMRVPAARWIMPIYTYRCENCGVSFDRRQSFNDEPLHVCPECQKETLRKVYLPVGIVFKGSGFYAVDNRSSSGMETRTAEDQSGEDTPARKKEQESAGKSKDEKKSKE
jgi:putative FmdB family regulatory protein